MTLGEEQDLDYFRPSESEGGWRWPSGHAVVRHLSSRDLRAVG